MIQYKINLTESQDAALRDVAVDPNFWINNMIEARIFAAVSERRLQPSWMRVALSFAATGGNPEDDEAVLAHGIETGIFKDAATRKAEIEEMSRQEINALETQGE